MNSPPITSPGKFCTICNQDVAQDKHRLKDTSGRYYCPACVDSLSHSGRLAAAPPIVPPPLPLAESTPPTIAKSWSRRSLVVAGAVILAIFSGGLVWALKSEATDSQVAAGGSVPATALKPPLPPAEPPLPPNVKRTADGSIVPLPGYEFTQGGREKYEVRWTPGKSHPDHSHVRASSKPGDWVPDAGYVFAKAGELQVRWQSGIAYPNHPHVISSSDEGKWIPADGYKFANDKPGDFTVVQIEPMPVKPFTGNPPSVWKPIPILRGPTKAQCESAIIKAGLAIVAHLAAQESDNLVAEELARAIRDAAIESALRDVFPGSSRREINAGTKVIVLAVEGKLGSRNYESQQARNWLVGKIREHDPDAANAVEMAVFIAQLLEYCQKR